jgi:hypothetical protein
MKAVADTLGVARSHLHDRVRHPPMPRGAYIKASDEALLPLIRRLVDQRPTYGYRRITALVNRALAAESRPTAQPQAHLPDHEAPWAAAGKAHWTKNWTPA